MGTLYLDRKHARIEHQSGVLIARHADGDQRFPLRLIDRVIVSASVELDSSLLLALAAAGTPLTVLGRRGASAQLPASRGNDVTRLIAQVRAADHEPTRLRLARLTLALKLKRHRNYLAHLRNERPAQRRALTRGLKTLAERRRQLAQHATVDALRGLEGAAARDYYAAYGECLAPELGFTGRNRRPPRDPANALLSLGYTVLHHRVAEQLAAHGLDPRIGFLHDPAWGRASLAADLTEPLRPHIDRLVLNLGASQTLRARHFVSDGDGVKLGKAGRALYWPALEATLAQLTGEQRRLIGGLLRILALHPPCAAG